VESKEEWVRRMARTIRSRGNSDSKTHKRGIMKSRGEMGSHRSTMKYGVQSTSNITVKSKMRVPPGRLWCVCMQKSPHIYRVCKKVERREEI